MKNIALLALASMLSLAGCGVDVAASCTSYIDAYNTCAAEAYGVTDGTYDTDASFCDAYTSLKGSAAADEAAILDCYAAAFNDAVCSTTDGLTAASTAMTDCATAAQ